MMRTNITVKGLLLSIFIFQFSFCFAQNDTALNRNVTVERDFQPVIQAAGKVPTKPAVLETTIEPAMVEYSDYTADVTPTALFNPLLSQPMRFEPEKRKNGYVRGAIGHTNTLFDFGYRLDDGKKSILDVYAHHHAEWGLATLSKTKAGMNFKHAFSNCDLYFGVNGGNIFYYKYGHFYDYSSTPDMWAKNSTAYPEPHEFTDMDKTSLWTAEAFVGVRSNPRNDVQFMAQTGYRLFAKIGAVSEHQVRTKGFFDWHSTEHHVGANLYVQNNFLQLSGAIAAAIPDSMYRSRHNLRVEPYYEYEGARVRVHAGVNIDLNIGMEKNALSATENVAFAPSPNIHLEAQIAKNWLTLYADVEGDLGMGSLQSYMEENRYSLIHAGIVHPCMAYTPVDVELGFHIRPHRDILFELHGGYAYMLDQDYWVATADTTSMFTQLNMKRPIGDFIHEHADYQRGKAGGVFHYHYEDIIRINLHGDYYFWKGDTTVYDRPNWEIGLRIDGHIDKNWSLYSDNHFAGSRTVLATDGEHILKPTIDLNLGLKYERKTWDCFFQLNNWLHRKNELLYGYRSQGINFLLGATYRF